MANIFLDANYFIGLVNRIPEIEIETLEGHRGFVSTLSCHLLFYINKEKVPNKKLGSFIDDFHLTALTPEIIETSLDGPTSDLEDNIQLHSAAEAECDYFLTLDQKLLSMKFFGKTKIADQI